jgi:hypothetical protein
MKEHGNKITIFGELTDLNTYINKERGNKYGGAGIKKRETLKCMRYFLGKKKINQPISLSFAWYVKNKRKDPDNIAFAKKFILDGMVAAKIIKNDGFKNIHSFGGDKFFVDSKNPRVEVFIILVLNRVLYDNKPEWVHQELPPFDKLNIGNMPKF